VDEDDVAAPAAPAEIVEVVALVQHAVGPHNHHGDHAQDADEHKGQKSNLDGPADDRHRVVEPVGGPLEPSHTRTIAAGADGRSPKAGRRVPL
jgi:hypothetical protein